AHLVLRERGTAATGRGSTAPRVCIEVGVGATRGSGAGWGRAGRGRIPGLYPAAPGVVPGGVRDLLRCRLAIHFDTGSWAGATGARPGPVTATPPRNPQRQPKCGATSPASSGPTITGTTQPPANAAKILGCSAAGYTWPTTT